MSTLKIILSFLDKIGVCYQFESLSSDTFLPGLEIVNGQLLIDRQKLKYVGDILHEAGHIAVVNSEQRKQLDGSTIAEGTQGDGCEIAAILWSYAALKHLNLDPSVVFHPNGYKGQSQWLIHRFDIDKNYIGLPLLEWKGLTNAQHFPKMTQWLVD